MKDNGFRQSWFGRTLTLALAVGVGLPTFCRAAELTLATVSKEYPILDTLKKVQLTGFATGFYTYNLSGASKGATGELSRRQNDFRYNDVEANQFTLDMVELQAVKPSTSDSPVGFGVTADYGSEVRKLQSIGFGTKDPLGFTTNAFDFRQAYLTYKFALGSGLDFKFGKFDSLVGLELNPTALNINTSRGLMYWLTPGTHTGLLLAYPMTDWVTVTAGVVNGWDAADDNNDGKSITVSFNVTPSKTLNVLLGGVYGPEQGSWGIFTRPTNKVRWIADLVAAYTPTDKLTFNFTWDAGQEAKNPFTQHNSSEVVRDNYWWGLGAIAKIQQTPKISTAVRGEWVRDNGGAVIFKRFDVPASEIPASDPNNPGSRTFLDPGFRAFDQDIWEVTVTEEYKFTENLLIRLEYRHDQSNKEVFRGEADPVTTDVVNGKKTQDTVSIQFTAIF